MKHLSDDWKRKTTSRDISELLPTVRQMCVHLMAECTARGIDLVITSTFRDYEAQRDLYDSGRKVAGRIRTHCPPGWSWHQHRCAFDVAPIRAGKPVRIYPTDENPEDAFDIAVWNEVGACARIAGLEWGGNFPKERLERAHFQYTYGRSIEDVNRGVPLPETLSGPIYFHGSGWNGGGPQNGIAKWVQEKLHHLWSMTKGH